MGIRKRQSRIPPRNTLHRESTNLKLIAMTTAAVAIIASLGVVGVILLEKPTLPRCPPTEQITINKVTFGATAGQVTFALWDSGTREVTIVQASVQGAGITGKDSTNLSSDNIVLPGETLSLNVTFPGVTFQNGTGYDFLLVSACGDRFPVSGIPQ